MRRRACVLVALLAGSATGVSDVALPPSGYEGLSYEQALAKFESQPSVRVLFEEGAADGAPAGSPIPRYEADFDRWPVPSAVPTSWYLGAGDALTPEAPTAAPDTFLATTSYVSDPSAVPATTSTSLVRGRSGVGIRTLTDMLASFTPVESQSPVLPRKETLVVL